MYEISTNYLTNCSAKWSRIGQENKFLIASILGTEVNLNNLNNVNNVNNLENVQCTMRNSSMENFHLDCLDQLILVVHLPDVSVINTNDSYYLL